MLWPILVTSGKEFANKLGKLLNMLDKLADLIGETTNVTEELVGLPMKFLEEFANLLKKLGRRLLRDQPQSWAKAISWFAVASSIGAAYVGRILSKCSSP